MGWGAIAHGRISVERRAVSGIAAGRRPEPVSLGLTASTLFLTVLTAEDGEDAHRAILSPLPPACRDTP